MKVIGKPEIVNSDQGSKFTLAFIHQFGANQRCKIKHGWPKEGLSTMSLSSAFVVALSTRSSILTPLTLESTCINNGTSILTITTIEEDKGIDNQILFKSI